MINIRNIDVDWGSHMPVLIKLISITNGPILEMGMGLFSTPFLHWACFQTDRELVSTDNSASFFSKFVNINKPFHKSSIILDWDKFPVEYPWDIVLIDHHPSERRGIDALRVANFAKYVVLHDSQPQKGDPFSYSQVFPVFKYRFDYKEHPSNTTILSNFIDLTNFTI